MCQATTGYVLRFRSLIDAGRSFAFACDAAGRVDLDALGSEDLDAYLYARVVVGHVVARPEVERRPQA